LLLRHPLDFRLETGRDVKLNQMSHNLLQSSTTWSFRSWYTEPRQALSLTRRLLQNEWLFTESLQWQLISFSSPITEGENDQTNGTSRLSFCVEKLLPDRIQTLTQIRCCCSSFGKVGGHTAAELILISSASTLKRESADPLRTIEPAPAKTARACSTPLRQIYRLSRANGPAWPREAVN
jgi:hypothetical protein